MQNAHSRRGFAVLLTLGLLLTTLAALGPAGPAAAAPAAGAKGRIGPGTQAFTAGRACTVNFVFRDARRRVFVGYAASCATRTPVAGDGTCTARPLPLGTRVRLAERGRTIGYGTLRYSSLRELRRSGVRDAATCAANDFALVEVRGAARRKVAASTGHWGGPSGIAGLPATGSTVFGLFRPGARTRVLPRVGEVTAVAGRVARVSTPLPSSRSARGSGFQDGAGRAVGILTSSRPTGANTVVSLAAAVAFARSHGVRGLRVVRGAEPFSGAAVL